MLQVGQLQQRVGRVRDVRHGPTDGGRVRQLWAGDGLRLPREQLRRGAGQAVRVQEAAGSHPQDRRQRVPGGGLGRGVSRPLPQLSVPLSQLRLRWHWRAGVSSEPPLARHARRHTGEHINYSKSGSLVTIIRPSFTLPLKRKFILSSVMRVIEYL